MLFSSIVTDYFNDGILITCTDGQTQLAKLVCVG